MKSHPIFKLLRYLTFCTFCTSCYESKILAYEAPEGVKFIADIEIREGNPAWKIDIAIPKHSKKPTAAILDLHGGGWMYGDKDGRRGAICRFAQEGFVGIAVRYRLSDEAPFPACVDDCVMALRWMRAHATDYGIDPNRIGAYGHSAGAHLAAMLGVVEPDGKFAPGFLEDFAGNANAVVAMAAPTDFNRWSEDGGEPRGPQGLLAGPQDTLQQRKDRASPLSYVASDAPPFLFIHGAKDRVVPPIQSKRMAEALQQKGAPYVERVVYDSLHHDVMMTGEPLIWAQVISFFRETLSDDPLQLMKNSQLADEWRRMGRDEEARKQWYGQFDKNGDKRVTRDENPGTDELFDRIDRGENGFVKVVK